MPLPLFFKNQKTKKKEKRQNTKGYFHYFSIFIIAKKKLFILQITVISNKIRTFYIIQRTIEEYNLQIPKEKHNLFLSEQ